jgi:L-fucose isomerase
MLLMYLLTNRAQIFADVRTYWSPDAVERVTGHRPDGLAAEGFIHLINSGAATLDATGAMTDAAGKPAVKPFWEITEGDVAAALEATTWYPANRGYFRGGGFSSQFVSKGGMPVTMARVNLVSGVGPVLQIAEGWTVELPAEVHKVLDERTDPTWPTHWFVPRTTGVGPFRDVYSVMANWAANHGAISYGHIGADLISLASALRIPVHMHNVPDEDVFRPSAWANLHRGPRGRGLPRLRQLWPALRQEVGRATTPAGCWARPHPVGWQDSRPPAVLARARRYCAAETTCYRYQPVVLRA